MNKTETTLPKLEVGANVRYGDMLVEIEQALTYNSVPVYAVVLWVRNHDVNAWEFTYRFTVDRVVASWILIKRDADKIMALNNVEDEIASQFSTAAAKSAFEVVDRKYLTDVKEYRSALVTAATYYQS